MLQKLDYAGISILIMGSTLPVINYTYACGDAISYRKWFIGIEIFSALLVFALTFIPYFEKLENKK